jgi:hypothetical protein
MRQQDLAPAPRGWLEKADDSNVAAFLLTAGFAAVFRPLQETIGFWPALALIVLSGLALLVLLQVLLRPLKRKRDALDAEQGLFECAQREPGSALRGRWALGYAKAEPGRLLFQARTGMTGPLFGPIEVYSEPKVVRPPVKAPWAVFPRGRIIELSTDKGTLELAATPSCLNLFRERSQRNG